MIKNRHGFVPKSYTQPESYRLIFSNYNAIYHHPVTGVEYHVQLESWFLDRSRAKSVVVLRQDSDCRHRISPSFTTIKAAMEFLEKLLKTVPEQEAPTEKTA